MTPPYEWLGAAVDLGMMPFDAHFRRSTLTVTQSPALLGRVCPIIFAKKNNVATSSAQRLTPAPQR